MYRYGFVFTNYAMLCCLRFSDASVFIHILSLIFDGKFVITVIELTGKIIIWNCHATLKWWVRCIEYFLHEIFAFVRFDKLLFTIYHFVYCIRINFNILSSILFHYQAYILLSLESQFNAENRCYNFAYIFLLEFSFVRLNIGEY